MCLAPINLGHHSTQEGGTPQIQQSSVLDSGAPATDKESAGDQIEMRQTVVKSDMMSSLVPSPQPKNQERGLVSLASSPGPTQGEGDSKRGEGGEEKMVPN